MKKSRAAWECLQNKWEEKANAAPHPQTIFETLERMLDHFRGLVKAHIDGLAWNGRLNTLYYLEYEEYAGPHNKDELAYLFHSDKKISLVLGALSSQRVTFDVSQTTALANQQTDQHFKYTMKLKYRPEAPGFKTDPDSVPLDWEPVSLEAVNLLRNSMYRKYLRTSGPLGKDLP
jgi:hypothetical protein